VTPKQANTNKETMKKTLDKIRDHIKATFSAGKEERSMDHKHEVLGASYDPQGVRWNVVPLSVLSRTTTSLMPASSCDCCFCPETWKRIGIVVVRF